ncbi:hypothetical protein [Bifidobacterium platyrrhinorum]|uniref:Helix-turn-helix domain-containing protein n=1 Tax=Bifidobacterium platyrrhinorum TaxID=2661628 RepID=A0A6L9SVD9_9BIFI|nr:hypothetical protein [Bifidobacterium platyrrhinorum]NEG56109.1 hypothetical protein [Bifidobacterium platyrrhinorum]
MMTRDAYAPILGKLLDNWKERLETDKRMRELVEERDRLAVDAIHAGADRLDVALATGLSRTTLWKIVKKAETDTLKDSPEWDIQAEDAAPVSGVPEARLLEALQDMLITRFDELADWDDEDGIARDWDDDKRMTDGQKDFRDQVKRLVLRAQAGDLDRIESPETGITLTRHKE